MNVATSSSIPVASSAQPPHAGVVHGECRIVADVGGTFARLAWTGSATDGPLLQGLCTYRCAEHASLAAILADFAAAAGLPRGSAHAVVAIAGVMQGDVLVNANLAWPVSLADTAREAGLQSLRIINDFEAVALAVPYLRADQRVPLHAAADASPLWPALVLGPGTGLGAALCFADGSRRVLSSEAGHAALAAGTERELQVLQRLLQRWPHVNNERVLSGPGLLTLYEVLCGLSGQDVQTYDAQTLIEAARRGDDALARQAVDMFCAWLGSLAGDLALTFGARSVFLAGGMTTHVADALAEGGFAARFVNKGVLADVLRCVPVWRVEHGALGVLGAAAWTATD